MRLGSSLSSHVTLDESLGIFEPQFLHLQSEPLLPLMQASWEDKYLRQLRYFINMGKRVRLQCAAGAPVPSVAETQLCWLLKAVLGRLLCSLSPAVFHFHNPASGPVPKKFPCRCGLL